MNLTPNLIEPTDDEVAAALAAVELYLAAEAAVPEPITVTSQPQWIKSGRLAVQGLRPARTATNLRWNAVDRLRRNRGGDYGVVGL